ncbi:MAG: glycosyltransferase family 1 protein [Algisphaera sp.]
MVVIHNAVPPREKALEKAPDPFLRNGGEWGGREGEDEPKRGRFVLNVGSRFPYKNVAGLIRAFALMRRDESELSDVRLVVVGPPDARYPGAEDEAARCGVAEAVDFVGYVDHDALGALYRDAALLAVPSLYEGFGLPTAEAMNAGTPVVSSNRASLPEVAGGAALLVDPEDDAAFAAAMARVLNDEVLAAALVQRGSERVTAFGLQAFGAAHLEVYDRAARG